MAVAVMEEVEVVAVMEAVEAVAEASMAVEVMVEEDLAALGWVAAALASVAKELMEEVDIMVVAVAAETIMAVEEGVVALAVVVVEAPWQQPQLPPPPQPADTATGGRDSLLLRFFSV